MSNLIRKPVDCERTFFEIFTTETQSGAERFGGIAGMKPADHHYLEQQPSVGLWKKIQKTSSGGL